MNALSSRLKAIAVVALVFAAAGFGLLGVIFGLNALPFSVPFGAEIASYRPLDTVNALRDLRPIVALTAAFLVAAAFVLILNTGYCDRMLEILADVLLMVMAAIAGFLAGYWAFLRFAGYDNFISAPFLQAALICPVIVFVVSLVPPQRLRGSKLLQIAATVVFLLAGPALLIGFRP